MFNENRSRGVVRQPRCRESSHQPPGEERTGTSPLRLGVGPHGSVLPLCPHGHIWRRHRREQRWREPTEAPFSGEPACSGWSPSRCPSRISLWWAAFAIHVFEAIVSLRVCSNKGISNSGVRCLWFVQTFLFGFASLGLLLKYNPQRPKQR
uniref:Transmembrane protein 254 n=1 Tax=Oryzias latipes TaxID=8090 RepID=A0A3B3H5U8_ORYLA